MPIPDTENPEARKIRRLEQLLQLAKQLRAVQTMARLQEALDDNLPQMLPEPLWELLTPDAMTGSYRPLRHADALTPAFTQRLLAQPFMQELLQTSPDELPRRVEQTLDDRHILLVPVACDEQQFSLMLVSLAAPPTAEQQDDLNAALEMIDHTLQNIQTCAHLHQQNITDDLTGLFNARHFHHLVEYEVERSRRYGHDLALIFIDLDYFKQVNDNYGHLTGSALLSEVGHLFQESMRKINLACRFGGDEFAILLPSTSKAGAMSLAIQLREALNNRAFSGGGNHDIRITASFGIASFPADALSKDELIRLADEAMYQVKRSGRNGIHCSDSH